MRLRGGHSTRSAATEASHISASQCAVCAKRFHAFRHKHRCQTCRLSVCSRCLQPERPRSPVSLHLRDSTANGLESVEVCVRCIKLQREKVERQQFEEERRRRLHTLELRHFGPLPLRRSIRRRHSCVDLRERVETVAAASQAISMTPVATKVTKPEPLEACGICGEKMARGGAVFTTSCSHSFHWSCIKTKKVESKGVVKCPTCRVVMTEMQVKMECLHSRVYPGNRFCRDCGLPVTELTARAQCITSHPQSPWRRQELAASARAVGFKLLRSLDYIAFGTVRLLLATLMVVGPCIQSVVRIPWLSYVDYLVFGCVRLLFHGALHIVYIFHRLLQPRRVVRARQIQRGGRYNNR